MPLSNNENTITSSTLPTGAATETKQDSGNASLVSIDTKLTSPITVSGTVTANLGTIDDAATETTLSDLNIKIPANLTVASTRLLTDSSGVTQPISAISLPLPTGAATAANQATEITSLASIDAGIPAALGQTTMSSSMPVAIASDQSSLNVKLQDGSGNPISSSLDLDGERHLSTIIIQDSSVSTTNSSTSNLVASGVFTGTSVALTTVNSISVNLFTDQNCTVQIQQSIDGTNWDLETKYTVLANIGQGRIVQVTASFARIIVTNISTTTTTTFRLQTVLIPLAEPNPPAVPGNRLVQGTITTACTDANINVCPPTSAIQINAEGCGTVIAQHLGTWTGLVVFDVSYDNGVTWEMQPSIDISYNKSSDNLKFFLKWSQTRINDRWAINCSGAQLVRLRATTLTSGTIPVTLTAATETFYTNKPVRVNPTYSAGILSFATAALATDIAVLKGSATKTIKVFNVGYSATQTVGDFENITLVKRSTANSGGTSNTMVAVPYDSEDGAATATCVNYTANPTLGTTVGILRPSKILGPLDNPGSSATAQCEKIWNFDGSEGSFRKPLYLRGTEESLAINQNGVTMSGNTTSCYFEWTEE